MRWGVIVFLLLVSLLGWYCTAIYSELENVGAGQAGTLASLATPEFHRWLGIPILGDFIGAVQFSVEWVNQFFNTVTAEYTFLTAGPFDFVQTILIMLVAGIGVYLFFSRVAGWGK